MALTLLLGGARSGKSALALNRARASGRQVVFVATGSPSDPEMEARIERHREERAPDGWITVEASLDLGVAIQSCPGDACVVVDCLSLWVANLLEHGHDEAEISRLGREQARRAAARRAPTIAVSNEVGMGIVPAHLSGRRYRDALGRVNAAWADAAAGALLVMAGKVIRLETADAN